MMQGVCSNVCVFCLLSAGILETVLGTAAVSGSHKVMRREAGRALEIDGTEGGIARSTNDNLEYLQEEAIWQKRRQRDENMCIFDFPLGYWNTSSCLNDTDHVPILNREECEEAAIEANVTAPKDKFEIPTTYDELRPRGCFRYNCTQDSGGNCYFYNTFGAFPDYPVGQPVCKRPRFKLGKIDATTKEVVCPMGYQDIRVENNCTEFASCENYQLATPYLIREFDADNYNSYPVGCFIEANTQTIMYNDPIFDENGTLTMPTHPQGTPICNTTNHTHFPASDLTGSMPGM